MGLQSASGGLTKSKLQLATAVPGDVVAGKTFYAGDKDLKTGSIPDYGYEPFASKIGTYNPGDGNRLYLYLPNADTSTQSLGGKITRSLCYPKREVTNILVGGQSIWQYTQKLAYSSGRLSHTASMTAGQVILFVVHGACRDNYKPSLSLDTPNCTWLVNYDSGVYTQDKLYMQNRILIRVVRVESNGTATATVTGSGDRAVGFMGAWRLVYD